MGNITFFNAFCVSMLHVVVTVSGDSTLGPGAQAPQILPRTPKFLVELIGSIVISLSHGCLPNDEGPGPQIFFLEPPLVTVCINYSFFKFITIHYIRDKMI